MSSSACTSRWNATGCRKLGAATSVPSRIREVTIAAAVSVGIAPTHGDSGSPPQTRWS